MNALLPRSRVTAFRAAIGFVAGAFVFVLLQLAANDWFGASDLLPFAFWTAILCAPPAAVGVFVRRRLFPSQVLPRVVAGVCVGAAAGFACTLVAAVVLGPWIGGFSFNVGLAWLVGGACSSVLAATTVRPGEVQGRIRDLALFAATAIAFGVGLPHALYLAGDEQQVHVVVVHRNGPEAVDFVGVSPADQELLVEAGVSGGRLSTSFTSGRDQPREARVVLVVERKLAERVELPLPTDATVVYVQEAGAFRVHPIDAPMGSQVLSLLPAVPGSRTDTMRIGRSTTQLATWPY